MRGGRKWSIARPVATSVNERFRRVVDPHPMIRQRVRRWLLPFQFGCSPLGSEALMASLCGGLLHVGREVPRLRGVAGGYVRRGEARRGSGPLRAVCCLAGDPREPYGIDGQSSPVHSEPASLEVRTMGVAVRRGIMPGRGGRPRRRPRNRQWVVCRPWWCRS